MEQKMLRKYAEMAVKTGINIQPNQTLVIRCPIHGAEFARECASVAYEAGAKEAVVFYNDDEIVTEWHVSLCEDDGMVITSSETFGIGNHVVKSDFNYHRVVEIFNEAAKN